MNGNEPSRPASAPPSIRDVPAGIPVDGVATNGDILRRVRDRSLQFDNRRLNRAPASAMGLSQSFWREWVGHRGYLMQLALRWMSGNRSDAEDVLSRASIKAHDRYLRDVSRIRNLRSWLARLLHNVCMDEHRKRLVRGKLMDHFHPDQLGHLSHARNEPCPDEQIGHADSMDVTMHAIMEMPLRLRHPFVLRFLYQYSNQEIARHLALTEVSVRKRIQLGRMFVRDRLQTTGK
jgi:RNA polymerase sigma-70 factor (ECF subfamily)